MPTAIFKMPFNTADGLDFTGYILPYDTGTTTVVRDNDGNEETVPVIRGGFTILENAPNTQNEVDLRVEIETSEAVMTQLKNDSNYEWVQDVV